jgi:hypothetical protein
MGMDKTESGVFLIALPRTPDVGLVPVRLDALDRRLQSAIDVLAEDASEEAAALRAMRAPLAWLGALVRTGSPELFDVVAAGYQRAITVASHALHEGTHLSRWAPAPAALDALVDAAAFAADEPTRAALLTLRAAADALDALEGPSSRAA